MIIKPKLGMWKGMFRGMSLSSADKVVSGGDGGGTFSYIQGNTSQNETTVTLNGVTAGNLMVIGIMWGVWPEAGGCTVSDGTSSFTMAGINYDGYGNGYQFGYLLSANSGNRTYTVTFPGGSSAYTIIIWEFNCTGTFSYDTGLATSYGEGTSITSGNISTASSSEVVFGGCVHWGYTAFSNSQINGVAAGGTQTDILNLNHSWYRILTATFTNGAATVTNASTANWVCNIIAFKSP